MPDELENPPPMTALEIEQELRPGQVIKLMQEYSERLQQQMKTLQAQQRERATSRSTASALADANLQDFETFKLWFKSIRPGATDLARFASSLIEGTKLPRITIIELRLRAAEFEAALNNATKMIGDR